MTNLQACGINGQTAFLQAFAQIPDIRVWYGPDTYMGRNLAQLFTSMADLSDEEIAAVHPSHSQVRARK